MPDRWTPPHEDPEPEPVTLGERLAYGFVAGVVITALIFLALLVYYAHHDVLSP